MSDVSSTPLALCDCIRYYVDEHLIAEGRDPRRMDIVKKHTERIFGETIDVLTVPRRPLNEQLFEIARAVDEEIRAKGASPDMATCLIRYQAAWDRILDSMTRHSSCSSQGRKE